MSRPALEVADIFRGHGAAWRRANAGHVSLDQLKVMSAIERCRTVALGGHVARCEDCAHTAIAYNSCRNRHCPKCQGAAAKQWLAERETELLPVGYFHLVFTLPAPIANIAYQNKAVIYDLLFKAAAEATLAIAADPKHLGARIGITAVLHTWGSAMTHHPHVHMIVPGGGLSHDGERWIACRPTFFLPVRVLSRLFRRLFLQMLAAAHKANRLAFFGDHAALAETRTFTAFLAPLRKAEWVVYAKEPFGGPQAVLAYLSRYTHRVAISNRRLISADETGVTFRWKDYRIEGPGRYKTMTLSTHEFIRRFLMHVLPKGVHRIRHYGLFANGNRAANIARARELLAVPPRVPPHETDCTAESEQPRVLPKPCPCCGGRMIIIETFARGCQPRHRLLRRSSGSTPHEAVTTNRQLQCPLPFSPALRRQRPRSRRTARVVRALAANIVMPRSTDASTPACTVALSPKAIASNSALQSPQASPRGQIPIASAAPPPPTSHDFVPWRFSDAGRPSAWMASSCRRPRNLHKRRNTRGEEMFSASPPKPDIAQ